MSETPEDLENEGNTKVGIAIFRDTPEFWDDERPPLPVEIPFEQEFKRITPTALTAMQAAFHGESLGILLPVKPRGRGRPKKKTEPDLATTVGDASLRMQVMLRACHEEKLKRQRESPCYAAIAATTLESLGTSTIELLRLGKSLPEAVAAAVEQIESHAYGELSKSLGGTYEEGLARFRSDQLKHEQHRQAMAALPVWKWQRDAKGNWLPVPYEAGLTALFPRPKYKGKRRRTMWQARITRFLTEIVRDEMPESSEVQIREAVSLRLAQYRRHGFPREVFRAAILWVNEQQKVHTSNVRRVAGAKVAERRGVKKREKLKKVFGAGRGRFS
jgi:hypothetical protein